MKRKSLFKKFILGKPKERLSRYSFSGEDLGNDARQPLARLHAREIFQKRKSQNRCPFRPFVLNGLALSLLSLKTPFCPVLWPFCPVLCPFCPSHESLKFAETVYDTEFIGNFEGLSGIKDIKGTFLVLCFSWARV